MATATAQTDPGMGYVTKEDIFELKFDIAKSIKEALDEKLDPINAKLNEITSDLKEASKKAEVAMELGETLQEELKLLQAREQVLTNKISSLEQRWRQQNLKFRGLDENVEGNTDLAIFMSSWLAKSLALEEGLAPWRLHKPTESAPWHFLNVADQEISSPNLFIQEQGTKYCGKHEKKELYFITVKKRLIKKP
ncbi:UNVERIFIED_CONTAM: hypothetical protein K2H54_024324 [Gekko kuhli]